MNKEILSLETTAKLARYDKTIEYIKERIKIYEEIYNRNNATLYNKEIAKKKLELLIMILKTLEGK
jgi:hypothetical protein